MITDPIWSQSRICREAESAAQAAIAQAPRRALQSMSHGAAPRKKQLCEPRGLSGQVLQMIQDSPLPICSQDVARLFGINKVRASNLLQNLYLHGHINRTGRGHYVAAED
ncbi:hypothetical protein [Verrucomicrobium spinosum]|uniref:hypothetical protein n=1 Tax=Verrucomicrobium spinosum TaxID=2736 RepID=UPI0001745BFF|nr:hypothetical protein [Verrucomicrobium spinosum]